MMRGVPEERHELVSEFNVVAELLHQGHRLTPQTRHAEKAAIFWCVHKPPKNYKKIKE